MEDQTQHAVAPQERRGNKKRDNNKNKRSQKNKNNGQRQPTLSSPNLYSPPPSISANSNDNDEDTISNASLESSTSARPCRRRRPRGGRKNESKLHIVSENQQQAGAQDEPDNGEEARKQLLEAENELYGYGYSPNPYEGEIDGGSYDGPMTWSGLGSGACREERNEEGHQVRNGRVQPEEQGHQHQRRRHSQQEEKAKPFETGVKTFNVRPGRFEGWKDSADASAEQ